jgi:7-cyano-7-deazaguanine synthase in queuosine biosynthesis
LELIKNHLKQLWLLQCQGGVDSSTVAGIMKNEGYKVIGITLKLYDDGKEVLNQNSVVLDKILWMQNVLLTN